MGDVIAKMCFSDGSSSSSRYSIDDDVGTRVRPRGMQAARASTLSDNSIVYNVPNLGIVEYYHLETVASAGRHKWLGF